jgi:uncharacterized membrane protein YbhN (UPF0104 family)
MQRAAAVPTMETRPMKSVPRSTPRPASSGRRHRFGRLPTLLVLLVLAASGGSVAVASLALAHALAGWGVFFFYTLPTLLFVGWAAVELAPSQWRRAVFPFLRAWRRVAGRPAPPAPPPAPREPPTPAERHHAARLLTWPPAELEEDAIRPWLVFMRVFLDAWHSTRARRILSVGFGVSALGITAVALHHFLANGWPLARTDGTLVAAAGALLLSTYAFKAFGWQLLFRPHERPRSLTLAAATGFASVAGVALPGRFDDAARIAIVRRLPGRRPGVGTLALSLFVLGLLDTVALAPLSAVAAITTGGTLPLRAAFAIVAGAGVGAGILVAALPSIARSGRLARFRVARWLSRHAPASARDTCYSSLLVLTAWMLRAAGILVLLRAFGFTGTLPLALGYLAGGAASSALPVSPAGAVTQTGVGAAVLAAAGVSTSEAIAFAVAAQALNILAGVVVLLFTAVLHGGRTLQARI